MGNLIGALAPLPRQNSISGLPVRLLPEETTLLLELKVAKLVKDNSFHEKPTTDDLSAFRDYRERSQKEQVIFLRKRFR